MAYLNYFSVAKGLQEGYSLGNCPVLNSKELEEAFLKSLSRVCSGYDIEKDILTQFLRGDLDRYEAVEQLEDELGYSYDEAWKKTLDAQNKLLKSSPVSVHFSYDFDTIKQEFLTGEINGNRAQSLLMHYCDMGMEESYKVLQRWKKELGVVSSGLVASDFKPATMEVLEGIKQNDPEAWRVLNTPMSHQSMKRYQWLVDEETWLMNQDATLLKVIKKSISDGFNTFFSLDSTGKIHGFFAYYLKGDIIDDIKTFSLVPNLSHTLAGDLDKFVASHVGSYNLRWYAFGKNPAFRNYVGVVDKYGGVYEKVRGYDDYWVFYIKKGSSVNKTSNVRGSSENSMDDVSSVGGEGKFREGVSETLQSTRAVWPDFRHQSLSHRSSFEGVQSTSKKRKKSKYHGALVNNTFDDSPFAGIQTATTQGTGSAISASFTAGDDIKSHPSVRYLVVNGMVSSANRALVTASLSGSLDTFLLQNYCAGLGVANPGPNIEDVGDKGHVVLNFDSDSGFSTEVDLGGSLETGYTVQSINDELGLFPEGVVEGDLLDKDVVSKIVRSQGERDKGESVQSSVELILSMPVLRKDQSGLPVNVWVDNGEHYIGGGHWKRIKFQKDKGDRFTEKNSAVMTVSDDPKVKGTHSLSIHDLKKLKEFVVRNKDLLEAVSDKRLSFQDFVRNMRR